MEIKIYITKKKLSIEYQEYEGVIVYKRCLLCLEMLSIDSFPNLLGAFLNKNNSCKKCETIRQQKLRESKGVCKKQPTIINDGENISRSCSKCKIVKNINEFDLNVSGYLGHDSCCNKCKRNNSELLRRNRGIKPKREVPIVKNEQGTITHRECSRCLKMIKLSQFNKHGGKTSTAYLGIHPYCKECSAEKHLISKYGITMNQKLEMIKSQNNKCKICEIKLPSDKLRIDHCHNSNIIRGILCDDCNVTLGLVKENIQTLENMILYLKTNTVADKHTK